MVSTAGQVLTFLVAARAAGVTAPTGTVVPLALLALVAMSVPLNVAGWGPREGVTAWAFGAAGLGAAQGVSAAVVYGVLVFVACLPGAVVLLATRRSPGDRSSRRMRVSRSRSGHRTVVRPMADRPYTVLSCSMSIDGYISGPTRTRLMLSNDADLERVDEVRASCDAILVGAGTIRADDPQLLVRGPARRAERAARGLPPSPVKVTVTAEARLDPGARFFAAGDGEKLVYCASDAVERAGVTLGCGGHRRRRGFAGGPALGGP